MKQTKIIFSVNILLIFISYNLFSQELDSFQFDRHLSVLDSLESYNSAVSCLKYIDSIGTSVTLNKHQTSYFNVLKASYLTEEKKDSMAAVLIEKEKSYLHAIDDTTGIVYSKLLDAQGNLYQKRNEYNTAIKCYLQSRDIKTSILGEKHPDFARNLKNLGWLYMKTGQYEQAEHLYLECLNIYKEVLGEKHPNYVKSLNDLGWLYLIMNHLEKAESLYIQASTIGKEVFGEIKQDFASSITGLAHIYYRQNQYEEAELLYIQALNIRKELHGEKHPNFANALNNLAGIYLVTIQYEKAESLLIQALNIREELLGEQHPSFAISLKSLANLYQRMGQNEKAESLYIQCANIEKEIFGEKHPSFIASLNGLASVCNEMGQYAKAESFSLQSIEIQKELYGEKHPHLAYSLINLARLYKIMGQYEKAEPLYLQALNIRKESFGEKHSSFANSLTRLADLYQIMGQYEQAEPLFIRALNINNEVYGEKHLQFAKDLGNLAVLYKNMGKIEQAEELYIQSIKLKKETLGEKNISVANGLNNLSSLYYETGKYEQAEPLLIQSLNIRKELLGENHKDYATSLNSMALLYRDMGQYEQAEKLILEANNINENLLINSFSFLSEKEKVNYHRRTVPSTDILKSIALNHHSDDISKEIFNTILFEKGLHLNSNVQTNEFIQAQSDSMIRQSYLDLIANKKKLYEQYQKPETADTEILEKNIELIEKELAKASASFREEQLFNKIDDVQIANNLQNGEVAVEFTHFESSTDSVIYAASILDDSGNIKFIPLTSEEELNKKFKKGDSNSSFINTLYSYSTRGITVDAPSSLYELIWKPMEPFLKDVEKIYYAPSGILNKMNINAISLNDEEVLADKYELIELMTTRSIAIDYEKESNKNAYLIGGVEYDNNEFMEPHDTTSIVVEYDKITFRSLDQSLRGGTWDYLKWTKTETESINKLFTNSGYDVTYKTEGKATEEDFKTLGTSEASPKIIHLATHGYFFPDIKENKDPLSQAFKTSDHPLLRSGLILAYGNHTWQGKSIAEGQEDGILTAYEISNMNLSNTDLVVLSACETGLGDIEGNEGVYGLQRSFKIAGVKHIIMSLWEVPDRATSVFMTTFYDNYINEKISIRKAFNKTQLQMRDRFFDPYNWAGFVLIE